ncbi:S9 family peptidase [Fredinandcohnia humi]
MTQTQKVGLDTFLSPLSISSFSINHDEDELFLSINKTGHYNIWKMDVHNQNEIRPLTSHNQMVSEMTVVDGNTILFTSDKDGNELSHLYSISTDGSQWKEILTDNDSMYFLTKVSEDCKRLYYSSTKDNPLYLSIFSYDITTGEETLLHKGTGAETRLLDVSPNEDTIGYFVRKNHSNMKIYIKKDGKDLELIPAPIEEYRVSSLVFITDQTVYFTTNYQEEFTYLAKYNIASGMFEKVVEIEKEDIEFLQFNATTNAIYLQTKTGPIDKLYIYELDNEALINIPLPTDTIQQYIVTEKGNVYICGSSPTIPSTIFKRNSVGVWDCLLDNPVLHVPEESMIRPERITYKSYDGVPIEAMFYQANPDNSNNHTIIYSHGGPQYNEQNSYFGPFQYLLHQGFNIFSPNFRGTPNYGTSFLKLIEGDWGGGPRLDILAGIDLLVKEGKATEGNIILFGGSYGGYMSLLLFGRHQHLFKACVDMFGPTSLFTLIETAPPHRTERMDSWIGNPIRDKEKLTEHSPISYVENIRKPLLILQGANDPRVKRSESDQMVLALQEKGIHVDYQVYHDEGHGFSKRENELHAYQHVSEFLLDVIK